MVSDWTRIGTATTNDPDESSCGTGIFLAYLGGQIWRLQQRSWHSREVLRSHTCHTSRLSSLLEVRLELSQNEAYVMACSDKAPCAWAAGAGGSLGTLSDVSVAGREISTP